MVGRKKERVGERACNSQKRVLEFSFSGLRLGEGKVGHIGKGDRKAKRSGTARQKANSLVWVQSPQTAFSSHAAKGLFQAHPGRLGDTRGG